MKLMVSRRAMRHAVIVPAGGIYAMSYFECDIHFRNKSDRPIWMKWLK